MFMEIMNREKNRFISACDLVCFYNINSRLAVLVYVSCISGDLEANVF